jgi:hypothetical protein
MQSMTFLLKSGEGQKHLVSELDVHVSGSQVFRHRGRREGQPAGRSGELLVGGASPPVGGAGVSLGGGGASPPVGVAGAVAVERVEGGAPVQRVQTVDVEVMTTVEIVVVTLVIVEESEVVVRVTGQVVRVVITISVVTTSVVWGGGGGAGVVVATSDVGGGGGATSVVGGGGGGGVSVTGGGVSVAIVVGGVSPHFGQNVAVEVIVVVVRVSVLVRVKLPVVVVNVKGGHEVTVVTTISVVTRSSDLVVVTGGCVVAEEVRGVVCTLVLDVPGVV